MTEVLRGAWEDPASCSVCVVVGGRPGTIQCVCVWGEDPAPCSVCVRGVMGRQACGCGAAMIRTHPRLEWGGDSSLKSWSKDMGI